MKIRRILSAGSLAAAALAVMVPPIAQDASAQSISVSTQRMPGRVPEYHVAQEGDTLYDLAGLYFGDVYEWPRLWSYNPQITNPHWIYPGDIIFLRAQAPVSQEAEEQAEYAQHLGYYFPLGGFYTSSEFAILGELRYARTDRRMLHPGDEVYLHLDDPEAVHVGQEFAINKVVDRIYDPEDRHELVGVKYAVTGRVRVTADSDESDLFTAEVVQLWDVIERGDVLFVNTPQILIVEPRTNTVDLDATIIDRLNPVRHMHEYDYIFVDIGYDDGVRAGNRFFIWDRSDEGELIRSYRQRGVHYEDIQEELPWQLAGEAMVIYTSSQYSTAVITRATNHEVVLGQRITLQSGY